MLCARFKALHVLLCLFNYTHNLDAEMRRDRGMRLGHFDRTMFTEQKREEGEEWTLLNNPTEFNV